MTTEEGNKIIAEFMGWPRRYGYFQVPNLYPCTDIDTGWFELSPDQMEFYSRWDWLMPVIEKTAKTKVMYRDNGDNHGVYNAYPNTFGMVDEEGNYMVRIYCSQLFSAPTLIEAAWKAVVDFLEWYNKEKGVQERDARKLNRQTTAKYKKK